MKHRVGNFSIYCMKLPQNSIQKYVSPMPKCMLPGRYWNKRLGNSVCITHANLQKSWKIWFKWSTDHRGIFVWISWSRDEIVVVLRPERWLFSYSQIMMKAVFEIVWGSEANKYSRDQRLRFGCKWFIIQNNVGRRQDWSAWIWRIW
jgi:hypothetical protein